MDQNQPMPQGQPVPETGGKSKSTVWIIIVLVVIIAAVVVWLLVK